MKSCIIVSHTPRCIIEHQFEDVCRVKTLKYLVAVKLSIPSYKVHIMRFGCEVPDEYEFHDPCYVSFYIG